MSTAAVALLLDIIVCVVAWLFDSPLPGVDGKPPAELYFVSGVLYGWVWLPVAGALTDVGKTDDVLAARNSERMM